MDYSERLSGVPFEQPTVEAGSGLRVATTIACYLLVFWIVLPAFLFVTGFRLDKLVPFEWVPGKRSLLFGWMLVLSGTALMTTSIGQLWFQGKGLPISHLPPPEFVARGLYRYLRHPLYVGYTAVIAGVSVLLGSFWSLTASTTLLVLGWIGYAFFYEEPILDLRFGESYREYRRKTALLLPKRLTNPLTLLLQTGGRVLRRPLSNVANWTIMFRRGNLIMVTYGAFVTLGAFLFMYWTSAVLLAQGVEMKYVPVLLIGAGFSILFFARFFWWLGHWREMVRQPLFGVRQVGFVSFGGFFGWLFFTLIFARIYGYSSLMLSDAVVRGMFVAWSLGRIGCLTYGCCYGIESKSYGILHAHSDSKVVREQGPQRKLRHPTQVYSFVKNSLLFCLVNAIAYRKVPAGFITAVAFMTYPVARTFVEFLRDRRIYARTFTNGHIGCAAMFVVGWLLMFYISPSISSASPQPLSAMALVEALGLVPLISLLSAIGFIATTLHWQRVGTL
jgi:prolipoprotein diacylglyceryltransferase/protein-S-isoprenylcysteine O-methyltransferase Ste14